MGKRGREARFFRSWPEVMQEFKRDERSGSQPGLIQQLGLDTLARAAKPAEAEETWECAVGDVKGCPIVKAPKILVPWSLYRTWVELAFRVSTEWMAYLMGESTERGFEVREMYFPAQVARLAHVEAVDELTTIQPGTIGKVHSHNTMAAFHSGEDEAHQNWPVEIVVNAKGETDSTARVKLECGRWSRVAAKILLTGTAQTEGVLAELKQAIDKGEEAEKKRTPSPTLFQGGMRAEVVSPGVGAISGNDGDGRTEGDKAYQDWLDGKWGEHFPKSVIGGE